MNGLKLATQRQTKPKVLCIQTRRILWQKKRHEKQLVKLKKLLLEKRKLAKLAEHEKLLLASN